MSTESWAAYRLCTKKMGVHGENPYEENRRHKDERWTRKSEQQALVYAGGVVRTSAVDAASSCSTSSSFDVFELNVFLFYNRCGVWVCFDFFNEGWAAVPIW